MNNFVSLKAVKEARIKGRPSSTAACGYAYSSFSPQSDDIVIPKPKKN